MNKCTLRRSSVCCATLLTAAANRWNIQSPQKAPPWISGTKTHQRMAQKHASVLAANTITTIFVGNQSWWGSIPSSVSGSNISKVWWVVTQSEYWVRGVISQNGFAKQSLEWPKMVRPQNVLSKSAVIDQYWLHRLFSWRKNRRLAPLSLASAEMEI